MVAIKPLPETRTLLRNISWQTFKIMLAETGNQRHNRVELSPTFNPIPIKAITHFLQQVKTKGEIAVTCDFRAWSKQQKITLIKQF